MKLQLVAVGMRMPAWITMGFQEYSRRFPYDMPLQLVEVAAGKRLKNSNIVRILEQEGQALISAIPKQNRIVILDVLGESWSTPQLANQLERWLVDGRDVSILIGGPEGLSPQCKKMAEQRWSLSALTFPHPIVRVLAAESLYRAWACTQNHPYHRE